MRIVLKPIGLIVILLAIGVLAVFAFRKNAPSPSIASVPAVAATPAPEPTPANMAINVDMSAKGGNNLPEGWGYPWSGRGKVESRQDESQGKTTPPSLVIDTFGTDGQGQIAQIVKVNPGDKFKVAGSVKSEGSGTFSLAVQFYDAKLSPIGFEHIGFALPGEDWKPVEKSIVIPEKAATVGIVLYADGKGKGWLDDISLTQKP